MVVATFLAFLGVFVVIGAYSVTRARATAEDYLVASRSVNPWLTGLSAVATQNSGFMFIGMIGVTYATGVSSMWLLAGSLCGTYLAWHIVFRRLREQSEQVEAVTIPGLLAAGDGPNSERRPIAIAGGLLTLAFLGTYAAAQLTAGSKALHVLFGWEPWVGAVLGAGIIVVYCFAGGIRASIWTDAAQSVVMLGAMLLLMGAAVVHAGGFGALWRSLAADDPALVSWLPPKLEYGFAMYFGGWVVAGFGMVGQPHVMIRAMALRSAHDVPAARRIYHVWFLLFAATSVGVGLACRVLLSHAAPFDAELALPRLSLQLLPGALVGVVLAGLFAATMSTADSQVLACSASLTRDVLGGRSYRFGKLATVVVTSIALAIALWAMTSGNDSVFTLVVFAWAALAASLGPLMVLRVFGVIVSTRLALAMMGTGLGVVLTWRYGLHMSTAIFEVMPGMAAGFAVYGLARRFGR